MTRILVLSDLHLMALETGRVRGVASRAGLRAALSHARAEGPFARIVVTGDVAEEPRAETYAAARELVGKDALVLSGNHDRAGPLRATFPAVDADGAFVVEEGAWRLVGIDTLWPGHIGGRAGAAQLAWLERVVSVDERPAVLFLHHPPVSVHTRWLDVTGLADAAALEGVIRRTGRIRLVLHGHVHMPSEGSLGGVPVHGTPSTAFQFVPRSWLPRRGPATSGYRILTLHPGTFNTQIRYVT